jgi:uncharacterized membrane protein YphA (DoxX/SURF4 family)
MIDVADHDIHTAQRPSPAVSRNTVLQPSQPQPSQPQPSQPRSSPHHHGHLTAAVVLLPLRIFLAAGWLRAGAEKVIEPQWWNGTQLRTFLGAQHDDALPFFRPVMEHVIAPSATFVAIVVVLTQIGCGIAIGLGKHLRLALRWAFMMNVVFILTGRVNPSAFYLVMELVLLLAIADGTIGVRPTAPSWRTVATAGVSAGLAAAVVPYVRTIEPAKVIDDPAMMLVFLGFVIAATLMARRAMYHPPTYFKGLWTTWIAGWMHAKPKKVVRNEYERRYAARDTGFAPPRRGTAARLPPLPQRDARRRTLAPPVSDERA